MPAVFADIKVILAVLVEQSRDEFRRDGGSYFDDVRLGVISLDGEGENALAENFKIRFGLFDDDRSALILPHAEDIVHIAVPVALVSAKFVGKKRRVLGEEVCAL